jgi:hypothetical protein
MSSPIARLIIGVTLVTAACSDKSVQVNGRADSALARDLALASASTAAPTFKDGPATPPETLAAMPRKEVAPPATAPAPRRTKPTIEKPVEAPTPTAVQPAPQQQAPAPQPVVTESVAPAPAAPAVERNEIASGTAGTLTSGSKMCATSTLAGDKFVATLNAALPGSNGTEIPAGSSVVLEVASVKPGDRAEDALITFRVRAIVVNEKTYHVNADVLPTSALERNKVQGADPNADKKKIAGAAIAGAILGQIIGKDTKGTLIGAAAGAAAGTAVTKAREKYEVCLPAGSQLQIKLTEAIVLS